MVREITFKQLSQTFDEGIPRQRNIFIAFAKSVHPRTRVGGVTGPGRLTANQALVILGAK